MNLEQYRQYCISKKGVTEEFPFSEETLVFKVMGKMFSLTDVTEFGSVNLKCDPEKGAELRERYEAVQEAYHMNKKHWITVVIDGSIGDKLLKSWIDDSYNLVVMGLTKSDKLALNRL
jgi:predicted DNA-binding protein (MmcQ/YjbR family)